MEDELSDLPVRTKDGVSAAPFLLQMDSIHSSCIPSVVDTRFT